MNLRNQMVPLIGFLLLLGTAFTYNRIEDNTSFGELAIIVLFFLLIYTVLITLYTWFYSKPHLLFEGQKTEYEMLHLKIKATVDKLIHKQRFIDQSILSVIEGEAQNIWVITTKLANELNDSSLQEAVRKNLSQGKHYTYFLPHPDNAHFTAVKRNLESFKKLNLYKDYMGQVEIVHLPIDTQFLLEEVVIYNPEQEENKNEETKGINGFTYYESKDDETDTLHMKIEGDLLIFLRESLYGYLSKSGLRFAIQRVLTEFAKNISDNDKIYLVNLLNSRVINDLNGYQSFLTCLSDNQESKESIEAIDTILNPYKVAI